MDHPSSDGQRNTVLATLGSSDLDLLRPHLRSVRIEREQEVYAPHAPIRELYFPLNGLISMVNTLDSGHVVEVGALGRDGIVGLPFYPGARNLFYRVAGQIRADCLAIDAIAFAQAHARSTGIRTAVERATQALTAIVVQGTSCNAAHEVGQRLAKWLLMSSDAAGSDDIALTHEYLAMMIGAQRPTVTLAARRLLAARLIDYRRGHIRILDRDGLTREACECYASVRETIDRVMRHTDTTLAF